MLFTEYSLRYGRRRSVHFPLIGFSKILDFYDSYVQKYSVAIFASVAIYAIW
jgi:hypothetical protein